MRCRLALILFCTGLIAGELQAENPGNFTFRAGVGYDFISQEYYLDSARYDPDSTINIALLKRDYLDDKKGLLYLKYHPDNGGRQNLEIGWEQTPDIYRALGWGHFTVSGSRSRLESDFHFERKNRIDGASEAGEEFLVADGRLAWRQNWSDKVESKTRIFGETVSFDSTGGLLYDYTRFGGDLTVNISNRRFDTWSVTGGIEKRIVRDSAVLDYFIWRGSGNYLGSLGSVFLSAQVGLEWKKYNWDDDRDNYLFYSGDFYARIPLGTTLFLRPSGIFEYFNFEIEDYFSNDYYRLRPALVLEKELGSLTLSAGPKAEFFSVRTDYDDDDFFEAGLSAGADYYGAERLFLIFENQLGKRHYTNRPEFYSDFWYDRLSLIGNLKIWRALSFELLFSGEWEWHEIAADDARLYLISSRLTCTF